MPFFVPSFVQKRLLRYALSRLEVFDTDALDLDSLGITWGQRSTFELRDISLRLEKISSTLRLPQSCNFTNARVSLLRVTIPADIYSSSIEIEVENVQITLKLPSDEAPLNAADNVNNGGTGPSKHHREEDSQAHQPAIDSPSGQDGPILPSTTDLAQSFLESETTKEKEELEAAISSRSLHIHSSQSSDGSSDDEELGVGLNEGISLPGFIAGFIKGVVERLQVNVKSVTFKVDMEMRQDKITRSSQDTTLDPVTATFTIQDISVHGVASSLEESPGVKPGKRLITFSQINFFLLSDAAVFSNYSHFAPPPPASPPPSTPSKADHTPLRLPSPDPPSSSPGSSLGMSRGTILEPPPTFEDTNPTPQLEDSMYSSDGRFSDAGTEDEYGHGSYPGHGHMMAQSHNSENILENSAFFDGAFRSQFEDDIENSPPRSPISTGSINEPSGDTPRAQSPTSSPEAYMRYSVNASSSAPRPGYQFSEALSPSSQDNSSEQSSRSPVISTSNELPGFEDSMGSNPDHREREPSESGSNEELSESKLFTHEEAESMYMSVASFKSASSGSVPGMPGAWGSPRSSSTENIPTPLALAPVSDSPSLTAGEDGTPRAKPIVESQSCDEKDGISHDLGSPLLPVTDQPEIREPDLGYLSSSSETVHRVAKKILEIEKISIWLPSADDNPAETEDTAPSEPPRRSIDHMEESTLSFAGSVFDGTVPPSTNPNLSRHPRRTSTASEPLQGESRPSSETNANTPEQQATTIFVDISTIVVKFDIASGWLLAKIGQKIVNFPKPELGTEAQKNSVSPPLNISLAKCSLRFLECLPTQPYTLDATGLHLFQDSSSIEEVILHAAMSGITLCSSHNSGTSNHDFGITTFTFGHASEHIISFDEGLKMRDSIRDSLTSIQRDISLRITSSTEVTRVELETLPVHFSLNLQQLDETLSWFGGLSTILELGSSVMSTSTVKGGKVETPPPRRGVHFATPPKPRPPPASSPTLNPIPWKLSIRMKGFVANLKGEHCSLKLKTTAVKIVSRLPGIRVQIDKGKLYGPLLHDEDDIVTGASDIIRLLNIQVQYSFAPDEKDLDQLLLLLTPSKDKYEEDDDIMLDTLFRQRKQGAVLRFIIGRVEASLPHPETLTPLSYLGNEMAKLSTVTKYLPQDDRPGILTLARVKEFNCKIELGGEIGDIELASTGIDAAHVSIPSLIAARVASIQVLRNEEELVGEAEPQSAKNLVDPRHLPMLMARFIADEMDPTVKVKLYNVRFEYTVPLIMAFLGLDNDLSAEDFATNIANSVVNLAEPKPHDVGGHQLTQSSASSTSSRPSSIPSKLSVALRDCTVGLNPRRSSAKGVVVFTYAKISGALNHDETVDASLEVKKASIMIIDNIDNIGASEKSRRRKSIDIQSDLAQFLHDQGYISVCEVSTASVIVKVMQLDENAEKSVDVEVRDDLLIIETCADSTHTLIAILNGLAPPSPPNKALKYRTEVIPIQDMLSSFSGDAFETNLPPDPSHQLRTPDINEPEEESDLATELEYVSDFSPVLAQLGRDRALGRTEGHNIDVYTPGLGYASGLGSFHSDAHVSSSVSNLDFQDDHFAKKSAVGGTAHRWDSAHNTYDLANESKLRASPLRVRIRDVHVIWNLYDGFDWQRTIDTISEAVKDVEAKATERLARARRPSSPDPHEDEDVIGDFLFNSIYIGIPANRDPRQLSNDITHHLNDVVSETGTYVTSTTLTGGTSRTVKPSASRGKNLRLSRSKRHKMTFELKGISADLVVLPPGSGETQSSLDVRVGDLEIFDHMRTSSWRKLATYMHDAGQKESGSSMVHLEILNVKPVAELTASEIATVLPLRLHVDQDSLDFMTRFFEFKDDTAPVDPSPSEVPFLQRVEVNAIRVMLDFKPKRVDYGSLRSGRTTEFMNFFVLDESEMVLRHVILYGVSGFDKLGQTLNDIWMPDIKANQLPGVLSGLAPIKSLVGIGSGFKDLVVIPMREYKKDGRVVRSIQKGAMAFAKTTSNELVKFGARLAIGTQTVLQNAEEFLNAPGDTTSQRVALGQDDDSADEEETRQISLYADQPVGVVQGLRGAYSSLERDLLMARDAIIAVPGEVLVSGSAKGAAKAVLKRAPTVILRPAIGASKAIGQTLLGAGNSLDPSNRRRVEDKYKRH
ncbi:autophagy- protein 2 [Onygenales sp. PD_40]|nr:autophagy- protein 2 [Onygenales sp. PD_40]KAK2780704.1 autophagy- protein 2 [Emmonsiellopsis sp. PD_33]KAK2784128.1 autophagy- protein 2 [Onygenales sp. PD_12]